MNLETLEAETEHGTLEAERIDDSYVTAIGEGQAIGIALLGEEDDPDQDAERDVVISLYEGGELAPLLGTVDSEGKATLESSDRSDFDATVELSVEDEAVTGTATFPDEETAFTAEAASGVAGVYWADGTDQDPDASASGAAPAFRRSQAPAAPYPFDRGRVMPSALPLLSLVKRALHIARCAHDDMTPARNLLQSRSVEVSSFELDRT